MRKDYVHFIRGDNCSCEVVPLDKWNEVLEEIRSKYKKATFDKTLVVPIARYAGCYEIISNDSYREIRVVSWNGCRRVRAYYNGSAEQHLNQANNSGMDALMEVQKLAAHFNHRYYSFKRAFSIGKKRASKTDLQNARSAYRAIKECVISPFDYANDYLLGKIITVNKADVSSAYASQFQGKIPTLLDHKIMEGRIAPTEEYPFAYYIKSHHLAVYNEFDSRDFLQSRFYNRLICGHKWIPVDVPPQHEVTILCKEETKYSSGFKQAFQLMYAKRKEDPMFKFYMNACIGMLHLNKDPYCSHIAAVIYGRCVNDMLKRCHTIDMSGGLVGLVNTDSISWIGSIPDGLCSDKKEMGSFFLEGTQIPMIIKGVKCYQFILDGTLYTRFAGVPKDITNKMEFGAIMDYEGNGSTLVRKLEDGRLEIKHGK